MDRRDAPLLEVAIGILVALAVVALWSEKDGAPE